MISLRPLNKAHCPWRNTSALGPPFHRTFADRNKIYVSSEEERRRDEEMGKVSAAIAVGVLVAPLALVGSLVLGRGLPQ